MKLITGIGLLLCLVYVVFSTDYCKIDCQGAKHVACNVSNELTSNCPQNTSIYETASIYEFNQTEIDYILHLHNEFRNAICNGSIPGFKRCKQMAKLTWDKELAYLAGLNTRNCCFGHDECRNTEKYKSAGQNLASISKWRRFPVTTDVIRESIDDLWFKEYKYANMSYINQFKLNPKDQIGHFTQLVWANATTVGCGATRYFYNEFGRFYFACDYAVGNTITAPVYLTSSKAGSGCTTGTDKKYPALCSERESLNPNYYFIPWN